MKKNNQTASGETSIEPTASIINDGKMLIRSSLEQWSIMLDGGEYEELEQKLKRSLLFLGGLQHFAAKPKA